LKIARSASLRTWNTPPHKRTAISRDECSNNGEMRDLWERLSKFLDLAQMDLIVNRLASKEELRIVHSEKHVNQNLGISPLARVSENPSPTEISIISARKAAAAVSDMALAIHTKQIANGFAFFRPGGSHAEKDRAESGAHFNSIAVAIKILHEHYSKIRVLVVSWDEHHSNGTQNIFYSDSDVLHISIHKSNFQSQNGKIEEVCIFRG
jgi:acetoin utilization deacetylase AcuC-like enzyme